MTLPYMGGKQYIKKHISETILKYIVDNGVKFDKYIEPFIGFGSVYYTIAEHLPEETKLYGSDLSNDVVIFWKHLLNVLNGEEEKMIDLADINKDKYKEIINGESSARRTVIGSCYSYMSKLFGSYNNEESVRHKRRNAQRNYDNQIERCECLKGMILDECDYTKYSDFKNSVLYLDPPYKNTNQGFYKSFDNKKRGKGKLPKFDSEKFWSWCEKMAENNTVFVSERTAPEKDNIVELWYWNNDKEVLYVVQPTT